MFLYDGGFGLSAGGGDPIHGGSMDAVWQYDAGKVRAVDRDDAAGGVVCDAGVFVVYDDRTFETRRSAGKEEARRMPDHRGAPGTGTVAGVGVTKKLAGLPAVTQVSQFRE